MVLCRGIPLFGGFAPPFGRCDFILWNVHAFVIHNAKVKLVESVSLLGSLVKPLNSFSIVSRHTPPARFVCHPKVILGGRISLFRSFTKPASCLGVILPHTLAVVVIHAKLELRLGIAAGG